MFIIWYVNINSIYLLHLHQELFTRKERPFAHVTSFSEFCDDVIDRNVRPTLPDEVPKHIRRLIKACWHGDMDKRYHVLSTASHLFSSTASTVLGVAGV
jgi:hypothetical protein